MPVRLLLHILLCIAGAAAAVVRAGDHLPVPGSWTLVHIPDTQYYSKYPQYAPDMVAQAAWIAENANRWNMRMAVHVGDLVENNTESQWDLARTTYDQLNGHVPYALCTGNHDCGSNGSGQSRASQFVRADRFGAGSPYVSQNTFKGHYKHASDAEGNSANSWHTFTVGRQDYLVLTCEWGPRDAVVAWMDNMIAARPWHRVIVVVHAYLDNRGRRYDWSASRDSLNPHAYGIARSTGGVNDGEELWTRVLRKHENVFLVCCGHSLKRSFLTSIGDRGNAVHQMLYNTQDFTNAGDGWLRLLEFYPDNRTVKARTYSTSRDEWDTSSAGEFEFHLSPVSRTDSDGDAMPDHYELQHGFDRGNAADGGMDIDGDGQSNASEFFAGTDPLNSASQLRVTACQCHPDTGACTLHWQAVPGKRYRIESSAGLNPAKWMTAGELRAAADVESATVAVTAGPRGFFRVVAEGE